jgi:hypothetical protein
MKGGLEPRGLLGLRVRSNGDSSIWKAFSTERRKKKVDMVLKGSTNASVMFLCNLLLARRSGMAICSSTPGFGGVSNFIFEAIGVTELT